MRGLERGGAGGLEMGCPGLGVALAAFEVAEPVVGHGMSGVEREHLAV
ncbi:hypothetical protein N8546_00715 [bacterium]|nr:hypothetical protein [bacterium]